MNRITQTIIVLVLLTLTTSVTWVFSSTPRIYNPLSWAQVLSSPNNIRYPSDPVSAKYVVFGVGPWSSLALGYPYHFSLISGINDTALISVQMQNYDTIAFDLGSHQPEQWIGVNAYTSYTTLDLGSPIKDSLDLVIQFRYWDRLNQGLTQKPGSILPKDSRYGMIFAISNLPQGPFLLRLTRTGTTPTAIHISDGVVGEFNMVLPNCAKDSINGLMEYGYRLAGYGDYTGARGVSNQILTINDSSIVGWHLKGNVYYEAKNSVEATTCLKTVLSLIVNNHDPLINLSDSVATTDELFWSRDLISSVNWSLARMGSDPPFGAR